VTAVCVGRWLLGRCGARAAHPVLGLLAGLVLFYALTAVPYLGNLVWLGWVVSGLGGLALALRPSGAPEPSPTAP